MVDVSQRPSVIHRDPGGAATEDYDLAVIGGGVYGVMIALEASLRGCRSVLLEKDDFGAGVSFNSLRIIHGGLRFLQTFDLTRHSQLVDMRRWFLGHFPQLVSPLPILMPLYQRGLRRVGILRLALTIDRLLSARRNDGLPPEQSIPSGRIISADEAIEKCMHLPTAGLAGAAVWHDAHVHDPLRLMLTILHFVCGRGSVALNYVRASDLVMESGRVTGVRAIDEIGGSSHEFRTRFVINAAGPQNRSVAARFDRDLPKLFSPSLAWNVLFEKAPPSEFTIAAAPQAGAGNVYFLRPLGDLLIAGTGHARRDSFDSDKPTAEELRHFLNDLNDAMPGLDLTQDRMLHVFSGYLPAGKGKPVGLAKRARIIDHQSHGGPAGLFSVSGNKFTESRLVARKVVEMIMGDRPVLPDALQEFRSTTAEARSVALESKKKSLDAQAARSLIHDEAVCFLDDLLLRRANLIDRPRQALMLAREATQLFDWDDARRESELDRLKAALPWAAPGRVTNGQRRMKQHSGGGQ